MVAHILLSSLLLFAAPVQPKAPKGTAKKSASLDILKEFNASLQGRLFTSFRASFSEAQQFNEFDMNEFQLQLHADWRGMIGFKFRMEVLRSAQPQSLFGIDGDAYIVRVQQAWGFGRIGFWKIEMELRFGLIQDPWVELVEEGNALRDVSLSMSQGGEFFDPSDIGFLFSFRMWKGLLELRYAMTNGEGTNRAEQNAGKNSTIILTGRPLRLKIFGIPSVLAIHATYRDGSLGAALARNHRIAGALTFRMRGYNLGVEFIYALGYRGDTAVEADGLGVWASAAIVPRWFGISGRWDRLNTNNAVEDAVRNRISAGAYVNAFEGELWGGFQRFRLYALYQYDGLGQNAGPFPGIPQALETHRVMVILSIYGSVRHQPHPLKPF